MRHLLILLLVSMLFAGCTDDGASPLIKYAKDNVPVPEVNQTGKLANVAAVVGVSGQISGQIQSGTIQGSFNNCENGQNQFRLRDGNFTSIVAVLRWDPTDTELQLHLSAGSRGPSGTSVEEPGHIRSTWTDAAGLDGTFRLEVVPPEGVTAMTQYHIHGVAVPPHVDPATVDPEALASVPGGC